MFCSRSVLCAKASLVTAFISIFSRSSCLVSGSYAEMRLSDLILYSFPTCAITNQQKWVHFVETNYSFCHLYEQQGPALSLLGAAVITLLSTLHQEFCGSDAAHNMLLLQSANNDSHWRERLS